MPAASWNHPTYEDVCTDRTGHAEVVAGHLRSQGPISYHDLLEVFWNNHNSTTLNRQGPDVGNQYRSATSSIHPSRKPRRKPRATRRQARFLAPSSTEIVPAQTFWRAEESSRSTSRSRGLSQLSHLKKESP